jgi:ATP-binding cassette subfamily C exporter for protease/lipase
MADNTNTSDSLVGIAWESISSKFLQVLLFSVVVNILILAPTWYMLEVFERVLNSKNLSTLYFLTLLVLGIYLVLGMLDWVRSQIMQAAAISLDKRVRDRLFTAIFKAKLKQHEAGAVESFNDLKTIQDFIASPISLAIIDAPFALLILIYFFAIDSYVGWFVLLGVILLAGIAVMRQFQVAPILAKANKRSMEAYSIVGAAVQDAEVVKAMGMLGYIKQRWLKVQGKLIDLQALSSDNAGYSSALSKFIQSTQTSLIVGLTCWLIISGTGNLSGAMLIVLSILVTRVTAPLMVILNSWQVLIDVRSARDRLDALLTMFAALPPGMPLPAPQGELRVDNVAASAPGTQQLLIRGVSFQLVPGHVLAIIGPSASGKSVLARVLAGVWPAQIGKVRLDGVDIHEWNKTELGPHLGYLPQDVELFDGTIAENIARFGEVDTAKVEEVAEVVGLSVFIASLEHGYETLIGDEGAFLSGGFRQRVALARALYGNPRYIILDEPNSSLDEAGETALIQALTTMKSKNATIIVITHKPNILPVVDQMMLVSDGQMRLFDSKQEVLAAMSPKHPPTHQTAEIQGSMA